MNQAATKPPLNALIQVWGKGYRVTIDSEEFQRLVPHALGDATPIERRLVEIKWGRIIESLYELDDRELSAQRAVLFANDETLAFAFAKTIDRHSRVSLVLVTAAAPLDWQTGDNGRVVSQLISVVGRLAPAYARALSGNPEAVGNQLKAGTFLSDRRFALDDETPDMQVDWSQVLDAVRRVRGVLGVATPRLTSLGANVVLATRHEAERALGEPDGYYDVRERTIKALTPRIVPWLPEPAAPPPEPTHAPPVAREQLPPAVDLKPVVESLARIDGTLQRLVDMVGMVLHALLKGDKRRK